MNQPLSAELRSATADAHQAAEGSAFIDELMKGERSSADVALLLAQQLLIYRALEGVLESSYPGDPIVGGFIDPRLSRRTALETDMAFHFGPGWERELADGGIYVAPATTAYVEAILTGHSAEFLLANHYVRYLGDLSGGQIVHRLVQRHYGIPDAGLNFYLFEGIDKLKAYKDGYRSRLDLLQISGRSRAKVLAHAVESFELNRRVFADLGMVHPGMVHPGPGTPDAVNSGAVSSGSSGIREAG